LTTGDDALFFLFRDVVLLDDGEDGREIPLCNPCRAHHPFHDDVRLNDRDLFGSR